MDIIKSSFHTERGVPKRPLMIGSSGGAGHNSGIQGLYHYLKNKYPSEIEFPVHSPTLLSSKPKHPMKKQIETGVRLLYSPIAGPAVRTLVGPFFPILPKKKALKGEIDALNKKEEQLQDQGRFYIDMLLDVFPAGYESVAIWNILQRNEQVRELQKLIDNQSSADQNNYDDAYKFYYQKLVNALLQGKPYTEIISSQAMALSALCDAVIDYNKFLETNPKHDAKKVVIHEYVIELPTSGAVYYFSGLSRLTQKQQQQMKLYAVNMNENFLSHFSPKDHHFSGLYEIARDDNPLVRPGFTNHRFDNSEKFDKQCDIMLAGNEVYTIAADEQIASIMLGSQAGNDTVEYIESLLQTNMNNVFVFGGQNPNISERIDQIIKKNPAFANKIVKLGNQGDKEIAALMTRSNLLVIRAGALSTQEQLAMKHNPLQSVFIHHSNSNSEKLTSGLPWEDANADALIADLRTQNVHTDKTSTERALRHFSEAYIITFIKKMMTPELKKIWDSEFIAQLIRTIPSNKLYSMVNDLAIPEKTSEIYKTLEKHLNSSEEIAVSHIASLTGLCNKGQEHLVYLIKKELKKEPHQDLSDNNIIINAQNSEQTSKCYTLYKSYAALNILLDTLSPTDSSPSKRIKHFRDKYESQEIQNDLLDSKDNFLMRMLRKIENSLAKLFPSIAEYFTFEQHIDKKLTDIEVRPGF